MHLKKGQKKVHTNAQCNKSAATQRIKTKLTNLTKECNKSCNPEGKKNLPSQVCKMQHYDHATNQPHNPATKCNNKLMQAKGRKRTFPHKSAKCNIIIYNKSCIPKENPTHKIMQSKG
jgi:hypothetical protein